MYQIKQKGSYYYFINDKGCYAMGNNTLYYGGTKLADDTYTIDLVSGIDPADYPFPIVNDQVIIKVEDGVIVWE